MNLKILETTVERLKKHDLVFGSPVNDAVAGIPIGDGDLGSLIWFESDGIHINVNKTDLWNNDVKNHELFASYDEEELNSLRHGGEIVIKFSTPLFDMIYQDEFESRLSLADATANIYSKSSFGTVKARAFASNKEKVTALECEYNMLEADEVQINFFRFGSRSFWHWYNMAKKATKVGFGGTEVKCEKDLLLIRQQLNGTAFCFGLKFVSECGYESSVKNSRFLNLKLNFANKGKFILYYTISLGEDLDDAENKCCQLLSSAQNKGVENIYSDHKCEWERFWNKSYVNISDDYLENLWYLSLYYSNSECRGAYPPHFTIGIWGFRHDYLPWNFYFHYNMQHMYAPLETSGHGELIENYFKMRRDGLPYAYKYAQTVKGKKGAFIHDVTDRFGRGIDFDINNCTPCAEIALSMYRHYRMNGDEDFLQKTALPVMKGAAEFYLDTLKKEEDGLYHIYGVTAYEGSPIYSDTLTDICAVKALFGALKELPNELVSQEEKDRYIDVMSNLPDYNMVDMYAEEVSDGKIALGVGKGQEVKGNGKVLTIAKKDGVSVRRTCGDASKAQEGFPDIEMSPLYPAGVIGLKDKDSEVYNAIFNDIMLHAEPSTCMQWCMMPLYIARMGISSLLFPYMRRVADAWLLFPNGFSVDCPVGRNDLTNRLQYNTVREVRTGEVNQVEGYGFRHFDMEGLPILAAAVNEALLQSYDGVIRIFPAIEKDDNASFMLYAQGGFKVVAEKAGAVINAEVQSARGESCIISLPDYLDLNTVKYFKDGKEINPIIYNRGSERVIDFTKLLKKGEKIYIYGGKTAAIYTETKVNKNWKTCGASKLGTPKIFD